MPRPVGRKPLPSYLKVVKGTARKHRINAAEPKLQPNLPSPPPHLSDEAKVEWGRVSQDLYDAGLLTKIDRAILAAYCAAYGRWQMAETALQEMRVPGNLLSGLVSYTKNDQPIVNPVVGIANKAMADMARYATDLGMTPSSRSRVTPKPPIGEEDPSEKYTSRG